jgi:hypothetical protein
MCSICVTIWLTLDGVREPVVLCTQSIFGC